MARILKSSFFLLGFRGDSGCIRHNNFRMFRSSSNYWVIVFFCMALVFRAAAEGEDTNIVAAAQADEDASWESVFTEENQIPFHINLYRKDGLYYEVMESSEYNGAFLTKVFSEKRRVTGRLGMKIHADMAGFYEEGGLEDIEDFDAAFRRFRLNTFGRGYLLTPLTYGLEFGMAAGHFFFNSGYIWFHEVPYISSARFGIFTPPMSAAAMQSSSATPLMEDAAPVTAFTPGDLLGIQFGGGMLDERAALQAGWFADVGSSENHDESQSDSHLIARLTFLPLDGAKGGGDGALLHTGLGMSRIFISGSGVRYRARPESYLAPHLVDTGTMNGDRAFIYNAEAAWQQGPLLLQGEFYQTFTDGEMDQRYKFCGAYFTANLALTGEQRAYNRQRGIFSKLKPHCDFSFENKTWGALEWSTRVSFTGLSDKDIQGGEMFVASTGLNLYLSGRSRIMLMGGVADVKEAADPDTGLDASGQLYYVQSRLQVDL